MRWVKIGALLACLYPGVCLGQERPNPKQASSADYAGDSDIASAYYWARINGTAKLQLTPDVAVHGLLAAALATAHLAGDRMLLALRRSPPNQKDVRANVEVATIEARRSICGAAYTPVWGDVDAVRIEELIARRVGLGADPWMGVPGDLPIAGRALWGRHGGVHLGVSPLPGGFSDERASLDQWRARCRVDDLATALDGGGVVGVLLFRALRSDAATERQLIRVVRRSRPWRYSPAILALKSVSLDQDPAAFVGDSAQWRAAHAAAKSLLAINLQLRDGASAKLDPKRSKRVDLTDWLNAMLPLLDAGAKGGAVDASLLSQLDSLFQPPVYLAWYVPKGVALAVDETADGKTFVAKFVSK
jgi:hypothetical protein